MDEQSADMKMLHQNIKSLEIKLTPAEIKEIEGKLINPPVADEKISSPWSTLSLTIWLGMILV